MLVTTSRCAALIGIARKVLSLDAFLTIGASMVLTGPAIGGRLIGILKD